MQSNFYIIFVPEAHLWTLFQVIPDYYTGQYRGRTLLEMKVKLGLLQF